ncbi:MAG: zinc ribbon domain-containing protein [Bacilli bacterium]|nr:zinc ribbon domain-containing protein [Bacilli bacterium]
MAKFCGKCGAELNSDFCTNCGTKATESNVANNTSSDVNEYFREKLMNKKKHNMYRVVCGCLMLVLGFLVMIAGLCYDSLDITTFDGYNIALALVIPGIFTLAGGILSIISRKVNVLLLISGIAYILAAIFNAIGIENISLLFILCLAFAPCNIVYYIQTEKLEKK